ncbi:MAG: SAM-dependent methyltransferase [Deltaproteobacteria bacterium]|nr:SAM-dependent methyltransferase [Deltaproteobacteria bacterium]
MLVNRTRKNQKKLRRWVEEEGITCYRLYDRDIPEIPLTVDWYEGRLHILAFTKDSLPGRDEVEVLVSALASHLDVPPEKVFLKQKERKQGAQYEKVSKEAARFVVSEGGLKFMVNLSDYVDTGLFLDHRRTRKLVADEARGKRFLNLFSYTGAFTVHAAAGGAISTTSVDLSNTYLDWAEENMRLNGFEGPAHQFLRDDIFKALDHHKPDHDGYELAIVDPPTMSRSKGMSRNLDLQRDHVSLLNRTLDLCVSGAVIYFSTNFRRFKFHADEIRCSKKEDITSHTLPKDFRDPKVHRCFRIVK